METERQHTEAEDHPLFEDLTEEEMNELALAAREEALREAAARKNEPPKRPFPRIFFWMMAFVLAISTFVGLFQVFSIPAIDFLITSAKLSKSEEIALWKQAVVTVVTDEGKGTGFAISPDGLIVTNHHVIEGDAPVTVVFPEDGRYEAQIVDDLPDIDLAVLQIDAKQIPYLSFEEQPALSAGSQIRFIGNPLSFRGIANEGEIIGPILLSDWKEEVMMIQAPVYKGNSGSPVFNEAGNVIGIIFATLKTDEYGKVGLFIPSDLLKKYTHLGE